VVVTAAPSSDKGHLYPPEIIACCVWLYQQFPLSFREVEELMLQRGVVVSYETIRQWCAKFGQVYANRLRRRRARPGLATSGISMKFSSGSTARFTTCGARSTSTALCSTSWCGHVETRWPPRSSSANSPRGSARLLGAGHRLTSLTGITRPTPPRAGTSAAPSASLIAPTTRTGDIEVEVWGTQTPEGQVYRHVDVTEGGYQSITLSSAHHVWQLGEALIAAAAKIDEMASRDKTI